jgi:Zn finger protein HypA/HybF involved in hydrogenase expression
MGQYCNHCHKRLEHSSLGQYCNHCHSLLEHSMILDSSLTLDRRMYRNMAA